MFFAGRGVTQNYVLAHAFSNIASANGDKDAQELRDSIAKEMTSSEIEQAQELAREWMESH